MDKIRYINLDPISRIYVELGGDKKKEVVYNGETWTYDYPLGRPSHMSNGEELERNDGSGIVDIKRTVIYFNHKLKKPKLGTFKTWYHKDPYTGWINHGTWNEFLIDEYWNKTITKKTEWKHNKIVGTQEKYCEKCLQLIFIGSWDLGIPIGVHKNFVCFRGGTYLQKQTKYHSGYDNYEVIRFFPYSESDHRGKIEEKCEYHGYMTGKCTNYNTDGSVRKVTDFKEGKYHGSHFYYYKDGRKLEGQYEHDEKVGYWTTYSKDGTILEKRSY